LQQVLRTRTGSHEVYHTWSGQHRFRGKLRRISRPSHPSFL